MSRGVHVSKVQSVLCRLARQKREPSPQSVPLTRTRTRSRTRTESARPPKKEGRGPSITTLLRAYINAWNATASNPHPRYAAKDLIAAAGSKTPGQLTADDVAAAAKQYAHLAPTTRRARSIALRTLLRYLREEHGAPKLAQLIPRQIKPAPRNVTATAGERTAIFNAAPLYLRCFALLCADTALRSGTAALIAPIHYNRDRRELSFRTKFESAQTLPVTRELAAILEAAPTDEPLTPYVRLLHPTRRMKHQQLLNNFSKLRKKLGIEKHLTPHDFRRTTAVQTLEVTHDIRQVQALLGHRDLATTLYYLDHRNVTLHASVLEAAKARHLNQKRKVTP